MGDEYLWFAGLGSDQSNPISVEDDTDGQSSESKDKSSDTVIVDYCSHEMPSINVDTMKDIDLMSEEENDIDLNSMHFPGSFYTDTSSEVAVIEPPEASQDSDNTDSAESPRRDVSSMFISGRIFSVTSNLVNNLQQYIRDGMRLASQGTRTAYDSQHRSVMSTTSEGMRHLARGRNEINHILSMNSMVSCIVESCYFAVDRTRTYTKWSVSFVVTVHIIHNALHCTAQVHSITHIGRP
jgi:hypothetical protein